MTGSSHPRATRNRFLWLMLLAVALLARAIAPEGWMPVVNTAGGIEITVCNGMGPDDSFVLAKDGTISHKAPGNGQHGNHPCVFAGFGVADTNPPPAPILPRIHTVASTSAIDRVAIAPGRGLAAPPPPATGPPALV